MRTIAVAVDGPTLRLLDALAARTRGGRSAVVRAALWDFAEREGRRVIEEREREIFRTSRKRLAREAHALTREQACP